MIFEGNTGTVYGNPTIQENIEIPSGKTLTVPVNTTLTVKDGVTLTNNGKIINNGKSPTMEQSQETAQSRGTNRFYHLHLFLTEPVMKMGRTGKPRNVETTLWWTAVRPHGVTAGMWSTAM